ncbi:MAG: hypothetical protein K9H11_21735, partial [Rhodospirillum sp.]|nr:hypothetical protein [Rhodospirillum sp.]
TEGVLISAYIDLPEAARSGKTPFIWEVENGALVRYAISPPVVALVVERGRHWRLLQSLSGLELKRLDAAHAEEIEALRAELTAAE